ncbi:tripartite tricarboxylate transporter substrate binding protein [Microbacterium sp. MPKO10]|uniref:Bug family tripartite tricarboxylate transporter substrate binding protein n=1 Tax=Microbacterium sp. MPKO10 TaxID=2989818 RepID=UPI0022358B59|nr:tripartite tricarboxylate transporter substrate-binding protein [Microbacterium sp. MPKO10]MCW4456898.1 tripartite tricarboxylate transporter substrate-binding protein [Microbacterium sp. MPKO10]
MAHSRNRRRWGIGATAITAAAALALTGCSAEAGGGGGDAADGPSSVDIIVPADPGGGWDQTGRTMQQVLTSEKIVNDAPVTNIGGAGGTVGLASLATEKNPYTLFVTGLVMVGAVETNESPTRIEDTTPIAKLTEEALVVVVPADSKYKTLEDLVEDVVKNKKDVTITGGSAGGADHILAGQLLAAAGVAPEDTNSTLNYIANSGGGEAVTMLLGNNVSAGISGVAEFSEHIESGSLRALAVSSPERSELLPDTPTITEAGYDVELTNWRGVLAPGDISDDERQALIDIVTEMYETDVWKDELKKKGWADAFMAGDEFDDFIASDITSVTETLTNIGLI